MSSGKEPPSFVRYDDLPTCEGATPIARSSHPTSLGQYHQVQTLHLPPAWRSLGSMFSPFFINEWGDSHFFKDVHSYPPLPSQKADLIVVQIRLQFLKDVISKAVEHMKINEYSNLKCTACTVPAMRTAAEQFSDLHVPDVPVAVVMRTATQVSDVHFSVMFLCEELSGLFLTNKSERIMTQNVGIIVLMKMQ
ncbi:hypothetical protein DAPPUDRAFT_120008 [Daphnia pulex]|uniref:Rab3GAP regulatory subunit C-terminal domain-containing protein n=1 Tax=Daphnia pulex TaxID=6669 RepID=E9I022_DAPPU|nr:hypothetical protein DAPPUDRAFT_120008 [Daphnia pulex]|eukprot:EFX62657.1 hypothetical protein DAPPUDRAFT_120008 [Daphnia pulex]